MQRQGRLWVGDRVASGAAGSGDSSFKELWISWNEVYWKLSSTSYNDMRMYFLAVLLKVFYSLQMLYYFFSDSLNILCLNI